MSEQPNKSLIEAQIEGIIKVADDHEKRIRWLERIVSVSIGALGLIKLAADYLQPLLMSVKH